VRLWGHIPYARDPLCNDWRKNPNVYSCNCQKLLPSFCEGH